MRAALVLVAVAMMIVGCVQNRAVQTVEARDFQLNCEQLQYELAQLGAEFDEAADESGATGKNIALGIFFWPGVIVNEVRTNKNQDSISDRVDHLSDLYQDKCIGVEQQQE